MEILKCIEQSKNYSRFFPGFLLTLTRCQQVPISGGVGGLFRNEPFVAENLILCQFYVFKSTLI